MPKPIAAIPVTKERLCMTFPPVLCSPTFWPDELQISAVNRPHPVSDLRRVQCVAIGAEHLIRRIAATVRPHERADVLPDDLAFLGNLEYAPPLPFTNQRIAARQALRAADVRAEERIGGLGAILPHRF